MTTTSTAPAACAGVVAEIELLLTVTLVAATAPNVTDAPCWNPLPVMVTAVPPVVDPEFGETPEIVGGGTGGGVGAE